MMLDSATKLLDEFGKLPAQIERPRTFMEIANYTHYEEAYNHLLAFYMDPQESHGFETLMLDALMFFGNSAGANTVIGGNVTVEQEIHTDRGRIDILVISDDHAILIENKIHARVNNPFDDYADYLDRIAGNRTKHKFLLTLSSTDAGKEWGFTNVTHEKFVGQMRSLLGRYVSYADTRHLTLFLDFLNTLENLRKGTRMDKEFVKLLAERDNDVETFHADLQRFRNELKEKVKGLQRLVNADHPGFRVAIGSRGLLIFTSIHIINVAAEDLLFHLNTNITPHGWDIDFDSPRSGGDYSGLEEFLQRLEVPFTGRGRYGLIHPARFDYDEDLEEIRPVLQGLIDKIATYQGV